MTDERREKHEGIEKDSGFSDTLRTTTGNSLVETTERRGRRCCCRRQSDVINRGLFMRKTIRSPLALPPSARASYLVKHDNIMLLLLLFGPFVASSIHALKVRSELVTEWLFSARDNAKKLADAFNNSGNNMRTR